MKKKKKVQETSRQINSKKKKEKKLNKRWRKEWEIEEGEEHPKKGKKLLQSKGKRKRKKYLKQINKSASRIKATTINNRENIKEIE